MAGDEIVADWLGDVYSNGFAALVTDPVTRFSATSLRFRNVIIYAGGNWVFIGKYNSNAATFIANALTVYANASLNLEYIDLYELGIDTTSGTANIRVLGINEY